MGMVVRSNVMAINANRQLSMNNNQVSKSLEKLSSGYRINRAGDDASGLAISEKMKAQIRGLETASANSQDGVSLIQTAEGALIEVHDMLNRMVELAGKAANGTMDDSVDRAALQKEVDSLKDEINRISEGTNFNGIKLLDGSLDGTYGTSAKGLSISGFDNTITSVKVEVLTASAPGTSTPADATVTGTGDITISIDLRDDATITNDIIQQALVAAGYTNATVSGTLDLTVGDETGETKIGELTLQVGDTAESFNQITVSVGNMSCVGLGIANLDVSDQTKASAALEMLKSTTVPGEGAINYVSTNRAELGALQNRLEHTINNLDVAAENMTAANSRIRDTDMAKEMMQYTKMNVLTQAAQAMLAQANMQPQNILQLLQ